MFYIGLYRENLKKSSRPRALMVGMLHHLVDLYHVVKILVLGPKMVPP